MITSTVKGISPAFIRAFFAIEIPKEINSLLKRIIQTQRIGDYPNIKWILHNKLHKTLKFLGQLQEQHINILHESIQCDLQDQNPFHVELNGFGVFAHLSNPHVIWVGIKSESSLKKIPIIIDNNLVPLGYVREKREYSPHLTIGRIRNSITSTENSKLHDLIESYREYQFADILVSSVTLYRSTLEKSGAIHTPIKRFQIGYNKI